MSDSATQIRIAKLIGTGAKSVSIDGHDIELRDLKDLLLIEEREKQDDLTARVNRDARGGFFSPIDLTDF